MLTPIETELIQVCKEHFNAWIIPGATSLVRGYWEIGRTFLYYESAGKIIVQHGDGTKKKVAEALGIHYTTLYSAIKLAEMFPQWGKVDSLLKERVRKGLSPEWTAIRSQVLPKFSGLNPSDRKHELFSQVERMAERLERLTQELRQNASLSDSKEEVYNLLSFTSSSLTEAKGALSEGLRDIGREEDEQYRAWIRQQPEWTCIITGVRTDDYTSVDFCHLQSVGARGSDYLGFPLEHSLHMESHQNANFFTKYKKQIACWFYHLHAIHIRYVREFPTIRMNPFQELLPKVRRIEQQSWATDTPNG